MPDINGKRNRPQAQTLPTERHLRAPRPKHSLARPRVNIYPKQRKHTCLNLNTEETRVTKNSTSLHQRRTPEQVTSNHQNPPEPEPPQSLHLLILLATESIIGPIRDLIRSDTNHPTTHTSSLPNLQPLENINRCLTNTKAGQDQRFESRRLPEEKLAKTTLTKPPLVRIKARTPGVDADENPTNR